jgi:hypothetical protein
MRASLNKNDKNPAQITMKTTDEFYCPVCEGLCKIGADIIIKGKPKMKKQKIENIKYDTYTVRYWMREGEYWKHKVDFINVNGKSKHKQVEKEWKNDHKKDEVKLIGITYQ